MQSESVAGRSKQDVTLAVTQSKESNECIKSTATACVKVSPIKKEKDASTKKVHQVYNNRILDLTSLPKPNIAATTVKNVEAETQSKTEVVADNVSYNAPLEPHSETKGQANKGLRESNLKLVANEAQVKKLSEHRWSGCKGR